MSEPKDVHHWQEKVNAIRSALTDDLRSPRYRGNPHPMAGHCYVASEALYSVLGGHAAGWKPMFVRHEDEPHWFLKHKTGFVLDPTGDQFKTPVPYEKGIGKGFLTAEPSKRAQVILSRLGHGLPLEKGQRGEWQTEGYSLKATPSGPDTLWVRAIHANGDEVGRYSFHAAGNSSLHVGESATHLDHQRKGLASAAYRLAEEHFGRKLSPEPSIQSPSAKALWSQPNRPFGKSEDLAKMAKLDYNTHEFQNWFRGSHVSTPEGHPVPVYHGTSKDTDFTSFKIGKRGAWFTTNPEHASKYAEANDSQDYKFDGNRYVQVNNAPRVIPAHLSLKNPYKMTPEDLEAHKMAPNYARHQASLFDNLKAAGHDGVNFGDGTWVAFYPHQIKSVFNTSPTSKPAIHKTEPLEKGVMQRIAPFNPLKDRMNETDEANTAMWQGPDHEPDHREGVPQMDGNARKRALHKLSGLTSSRRNSQTGEREFLLHRGMSKEEYEKVTHPANITHPDVVRGAKDHSKHVNHDTSSSWTARRSFAGSMARQYAGKVVSAWVPESAIHNIPKQYGKLDPNVELDNWENDEYQPPKGENDFSPELEVIVGADHNSRLADGKDLKPLASLHGRINAGVKHTEIYGDDPRINAGFTKERLQAGRLRGGNTKIGTLEKAIKDIRPGRVIVQHPTNGNVLYDYSHVLKSDHIGKGYQLRVHSSGNKKLHVEVKHMGEPVGFLKGEHKGDSLIIDHSDLEEGHHGQGLGVAMYEAAMAHGLHRGAKQVVGDSHSTAASRVHQKLAAKHGLGYRPKANPDNDEVSLRSSSGGYDGKFGPYNYLIKSESPYRPPWSMTFQEFMGHKIGSPMGDRSRDPGSVEQLKAETPHLHSYKDDDWAVKDWLGRGYGREYDMSHLAEHVKQNRPIKIYRATDKEDVIHPGAYVTPSRTYAEHHGERNMGAAKYHVLEHVAHPDELLAMNPNEFYYAPRDLKNWHRGVVEHAIKQGRDVPEHVAQEHGLTLPPKTMKAEEFHEAPTRAVSIVCQRPDGLFLMGKRRDTGKWCCPGGHVEVGETFHEAAIRELFEETGITPVMMEYLGAGAGGKGGSVPVLVYSAMGYGHPTTANDPDGEFEQFRWVSPYQDLPSDMELQHEHDIATRLLGLTHQKDLTESPNTDSIPPTEQ